MATIWTIAIDWDSNSNFTDTNDNVTPYVMGVNWFLGMRQLFQEVAIIEAILQEISFFASFVVFEIFDDRHSTQSNWCSGKLKRDRLGNGS